MPTIAASTPARSLTCGNRMKLATPVKRGAFIASTGRYRFPPPPLAGEGRGGGSGTGKLRLDRLHALLVDDADHLVAQLGKARAAHHIDVPRPRQIHAQRGTDAPRPVCHDVNHV